MGATRTIRRALVAITCLALLGACHSDGKRASRRMPSQTPSSSCLQHSQVRPPRRSRDPRKPRPRLHLRWFKRCARCASSVSRSPPPTAQSALLSFGTGRLLQASVDKATFRDNEQGDVITEASIGAVRAVAHGSDGSLFAVGASGGARLEPRAKVAKHFPRVPFLPGSLLLPDLEQPSHFFVYYPEDSQLFWYPFESEPAQNLADRGKLPTRGLLRADCPAA